MAKMSEDAHDHQHEILLGGDDEYSVWFREWDRLDRSIRSAFVRGLARDRAECDRCRELARLMREARESAWSINEEPYP